MNWKRLLPIYYEIFGVHILEIYEDRKLAEAKSIIITDFASNGFFWAQFEHEAVTLYAF
jgi:hypothetical protein